MFGRRYEKLLRESKDRYEAFHRESKERDEAFQRESKERDKAFQRESEKRYQAFHGEQGERYREFARESDERYEAQLQFTREFIRRNELVMSKLVEKVERLTEESRAQTEAIFQVLDRLNNGGEATAT